MTYHPAGGLGSVTDFVVDTHFSERLRQLRLARLLIDVGQRYGLGVDETSAVELNHNPVSGQLELMAIGAAGAWLLDTGADAVEKFEPSSAVALFRLAPGKSLGFDPESGLALVPHLPGAAPGKPCRTISSAISFNDLWQLAPRARAADAPCYVLPVDADDQIRVVLYDPETDPGSTQDGFEPARILALAVESLVAPAAPD